MKKKIIFSNLMIEFIEQQNVYNIEVKSSNGDWLEDMESDCRFLKFIQLEIYGVPTILNEDLENSLYEGDTSKFNNIGRLTGYCIPFEDILEEGGDPIVICDDVSADLSFVASNIQDYYEENEFDFLPTVFYIEELEIYEQYCNNGLGSKVLQELPYILKYHKGIKLDCISYYPRPMEGRERPETTPYEEAMMRQAAFALNELYGGESAASQISKEQVVALPRNYSREEIDEIIEIEKNAPSYEEEYKNTDLFKFYEKNGFKEFRRSRLLVKEL